MNYQAVPANNKPQTVYRRTGTIGRIMNTVRPLKHEPDRKKRLIDAIQYGHTKEALRLIRNTGMTARDVNAKDQKGNTALMMASKKGHTEIIQALIEAGADVNAKDEDGITPLHEVKNGDSAQALIAAGADVNANDSYDRSPLFSEYLDVVQALIAAGADVNVKNKGGDTPLYYARDTGYADVVQALIAAGADVNEKNKSGDTPLHYAQDADIIQALIAAGADVNAKNEYGNTPLYYARDAYGAHALIAAGADFGHTEAIQALRGDIPIDRLNIPITERDFNLTHNTDPVSLNTINEGDEYYMMNSNVNPYSRGTLDRLLKNKNPISPITRQPIVDIRRHKRANANVTLVSGGRKRTRKHRKSLKRR